MNVTQAELRHHEAMEFVDRALVAKRDGDQFAYANALRDAFGREKEAAALVAGDFGLEPTRSVLHRSAASLAYQRGEWREAERLIATALAGFPPDEIANELRDLLDQVHAKLGRRGAQQLV